MSVIHIFLSYCYPFLTIICQSVSLILLISRTLFPSFSILLGTFFVAGSWSTITFRTCPDSMFSSASFERTNVYGHTSPFISSTLSILPIFLLCSVITFLYQHVMTEQ